MERWPTGRVALPMNFDNMLTRVIGSLDFDQNAPGEGRPEGYRALYGSRPPLAQRAASLTQRLLAFSRRQSLNAQPVPQSISWCWPADLLQGFRCQSPAR